jgi:hypothetical protein
MSREDITPADHLMWDLTGALETSIDEPDKPLVDIGGLTERGKPAVTSLYVESLLAIDRLPKPNPIRRLLRLGHTALSEEGEEMLAMVDDATLTNPIYDPREYKRYKQTDWFNGDYSPISSVMNEKNQDVAAEIGLACLSAGYDQSSSIKARITSSAAELVSTRIVRAMGLKGVVDTKVLKLLSEVRAEGNYSDRDYIIGILGTADAVNKDILARQAALKQSTKHGSTLSTVSAYELENAQKDLEIYYAEDKKFYLSALAGGLTIEAMDIAVDRLIPGTRGSIVNYVGFFDLLMSVSAGFCAVGSKTSLSTAQNKLKELTGSPADTKN